MDTELTRATTRRKLRPDFYGATDFSVVGCRCVRFMFVYFNNLKPLTSTPRAFVRSHQILVPIPVRFRRHNFFTLRASDYPSRV